MHYKNLDDAQNAFWNLKQAGRISARRTKYHFALLQPGDSIFIAHPVDGGKSIRSAAAIYARVHEQSFSVKKVENGVLLIRNADGDDLDFDGTQKPVKKFIPVPHPTWPLHAMTVGDKPLVVPAGDHPTKNVRLSVHDWSKRNRMGFSVVAIHPDSVADLGEGTLIYRVR